LPIIVTLVGVALSAWLLPAITRQWDDRQKAHDLKATLVAKMTSDTARTLEQERANLYRESVPFLNLKKASVTGLPATLPPIQTEWAVASIGTDAKMQAFFPGTLELQQWTGYRELIDALLQWLGGTQRWDWQFRDESDAELVDEIAHVEVLTNVTKSGDIPSATTQGWLKRFVHTHGRLVRLVAQEQGGSLPPRRAAEAAVLAKAQLAQYRSLENVLLAVETQITTGLLAAHPKGYSTTSSDFFHDLVP
jgi:hypothetical protein